MWRGIRVRITALATVVVIVVLIVVAFTLVAAQRRVLTDSLDESLAARTSGLAALVADDAVAPLLGTQGDDDSIAQIVSADGMVIASTENIADRPALASVDAGTDVQLRSLTLVEGEPDYRLRSQRVGDVTIHTATPLDDIDEAIAALRLELAIIIPVVAVALGLVVWWLVGRTLRPVESIRREVADISGSSLDRRVPVPDTGDEIEGLARTMNAMLDRVEIAVEREQRFVADASHELRSPLTRMRAELEVDLSHPTGADLLATHRSVLEETESLQRLVEDLLVLARHDTAPGTFRPHTPVDLDDIVLREMSRLRETSAVEVDTSAVSAAQVDGDRADLSRAIRNVVENAGRHALSAVSVSLAEDAHRAVLTVADDGPGIPPLFRERAFERFARLDDARARADGGTGLGLAIARDIIERHGGTIVIDEAANGGALVIVQLPLASAAC